MSVRRLALRLTVAAALVAAGVLLYRALGRYSAEEIAASLGAIPPARLAAALAFAAGSYLCLTGFDWLAVRFAGTPLAWRRVALASFASLSIGHNIGVAALSSGAIRYRFYSRWGLGAGAIAKVVLFCAVTVALGLATVGGAALLLQPAFAAVLPGAVRPVLGLTSLAVPAVYLLLAAFLRKPVRIRGRELGLPRLPLAIGQVAVGTANFACVAASLHQLVAAFSDASYFEVAGAYVLGNVAAMASHVPGGLGVLEASVLYLMPGAASIGAVVAFRVVYFFVPLALGLPLLLASEYLLRGRSAEAGERAGEACEDGGEAAAGGAKRPEWARRVQQAGAG